MRRSGCNDSVGGRCLGVLVPRRLLNGTEPVVEVQARRIKTPLMLMFFCADWFIAPQTIGISKLDGEAPDIIWYYAH